MLKRVLIIHPEGNSFNNPTMKCVIDLLCDHAVEVHIAHEKTAAPMAPYRGITYHPWSPFWGKIKTALINKLSSIKIIEAFLDFQYLFSSIEADLIIGVDREGLIEASYLAAACKKPYVFFCFEIMFEEETSVKFKAIEKDASKRASKWFVQDARRGSLLQLENDLDPSLCTRLPLASKGVGRFSSKCLRDDLGVPEHSRVAVFMGSLSEWSMAPDILRSVVNWPSNWCLIMHGRYGKTYEFINNSTPDLLSMVGEKLFISEARMDMVDDMSYLLSGVDAGLAFYKPDYSGRYTGRNLKDLGLASGKISSFLRYGIPVIINQIGTYSDLARKYRFGLSITSISELPDALLQINRSEFSDNAKEFFLSQLDFTLYEKNVWNDLESAAIVP